MQSSRAQSSLVRVLTGQQPPDSGEIEVGETVVLGVYDQMGIKIENPEQTVLDYVLECVQAKDNAARSDLPDEARRLLRRFEFPRQRWNQRISVLSGGERRRLQILSVIIKDPNFLVLDEASADLDLATVHALEEYLNEFKGVLVIVSHDRFFADKVTDHLFVFEGNGEIKDFSGSLSEYASTLIELENHSMKMPSSGDDGGDKKASYKDERANRNEVRNTIRQAKRGMENLENSMEKLRSKAALMQKEIDDSASAGWSVLAELTNKLDEINDEIEQQELRWLELAEQMEKVEVEASV
jgi:ABC transport system ATP-binding/permease protein